MSLLGYRSSNHPQQTAKRGAKPEIDDRQTSPEVFDPLNERFGFTLDVAASHTNTKCKRYFTIGNDGLMMSWAGQRVWCNPPYSDIPSWVAKAWRQAPDTQLIVMLLPANCTEQGWWQDMVEPYRGKGGFQVEFLRGRLRFIRVGQETVGPNERPPFGCCLLIWGRDG